jgi:tetratricopeptide (TPR) repeat protein
MGDLTEALQDFGEAIRLKPNHRDAYGNRAGIWKERRDYKAAIADLESYLHLSGDARYRDQAEVEQQISQLRQKISRSNGTRRDNSGQSTTEIRPKSGKGKASPLVGGKRDRRTS